MIWLKIKYDLSKKTRRALIVSQILFLLLFTSIPFTFPQVIYQEPTDDKLIIEETNPNEYEFYTKDNDKIEIKTVNNIPEFTIYKWGDESYFKTIIPSIQTIDSLNDNKVSWSNTLLDVNLYPLNFDTFGSLEFEIVFKQKPSQSLISFPIEYQNLRFVYQDALTQEEIKQGVIRPDNVTGSYAVYHEYKKNNYQINGEWYNYTTGKAFHIYRPLLIDALGKTSWCNLFIDEKNKIMSISWNPLFMESAVYPVILDPTFGKTNVGASWMGGWYNNAITVCRYVMGASDGTLDSITVWLQDNNEKFYALIYDDSSSQPNDLIGNSVETTSSGSNTWHTATMSSESLTANAVYHLGAIVETSNSGKMDTGSANQRTNNLNTYPNMPDPFNLIGATYQNQEISIYATYTVGGIAYTSYHTETWSITDAIIKGIMKAFGNIFGLGDAVARGVMKSFSDAAGFQDSFDGLVGYLASLVDTLAFALDDFERTGTFVRSLPEGLSILDSVYASIAEAFLVALTDLMTIIDSSFTRDQALTVMIPLGFYFLILMSIIGIILLIFSKVIGRMIGGFVFIICMVLVNNPLQYVFPSHTTTLALDATLQSLLTTLYVVLIVANFGLAIYSYMKNSEYGRYP